MTIIEDTCRNGHPLSKSGTYRGQCRACRIARNAERARSGDSWAMLPVEPLRTVLWEACDRRDFLDPKTKGIAPLAHEYSMRYGNALPVRGVVLAGVVGVADPYNTLSRILYARSRWVREDVADQWLTLIGSHLDLVYPQAAA